MTKKRKSGFQPITFKSKAALAAFADTLVDGDWDYDIGEFARDCADPTRPAARLRAYFKKHNLHICEDGFKTVLSEIGKITSWKQYILKHWNNPDARDWFQASIESLVVKGYFTTCMAPEDAVDGVTFIPFPRKAKSRAKRK